MQRWAFALESNLLFRTLGETFVVVRFEVVTTDWREYFGAHATLLNSFRVEALALVKSTQDAQLRAVNKPGRTPHMWSSKYT